MNGQIDGAGRALIRIDVRSLSGAERRATEAWIDTGFTGELVLPQDVIDALGLAQSGSVNAELGDGSVTTLPTFTCLIDWFGQLLAIEIVANVGSLPLLGVGLLKERKLTIDYRQKLLVIELSARNLYYPARTTDRSAQSPLAATGTPRFLIATS